MIKITNNIMSNSKELHGIIYMLECCFSFSLMYCIARYLSSTVNPLVMVFYRNLFALIIMLPFLLKKYQFQEIILNFNLNNLLRGIFGFLSMYLWFIAISGAPVNTIVSISFLTPIITSLLAVIILKEPLTIYKLFALTIGFVGSFIIIQPQLGKLDQYILCSLASCFTWSISNLLVKKLVKSQNPYIIVFYMSLIITMICSPFLIKNWYIPSLKEIILLLLIGGLSNIAQIFLAKAYEKTPITIVMPFDFSRLIFSSIITYVMFKEILQINNLIGSIMIIFAGYLVVRKVQLP